MYGMEEMATASDGRCLPIGRLVKTYTEDANSRISTISVTYMGETYVMTFTWFASGNPATISPWIRVVS